MPQRIVSGLVAWIASAGSLLAGGAGTEGCAGALTTLFASNGGGSVGGQVFFDAKVLDPAGIVVTGIELNTGASLGTQIALTVFVTAGTYVGNEANPGAWMQVATGSGFAAGLDLPSACDVSDFLLPAGSWGMALVLDSAGFRYTNGNGSNQVYANGELELHLGAASNVPFGGLAFTPRVWNGTLAYTCGTMPAASNYCTAKITSSGCVPAIDFVGIPSSTGNYVVSCSNVEAQQLGVLFHGINGPAASPFQGGFLCVAPPVARLAPMDSGGSATCSGAYSQALSALISTLPAGQQVHCQFWFRDPLAATGSGLSDANQFTVQ